MFVWDRWSKLFISLNKKERMESGEKNIIGEAAVLYWHILLFDLRPTFEFLLYVKNH